jgi:hypothetical protein
MGYIYFQNELFAVLHNSLMFIFVYCIYDSNVAELRPAAGITLFFQQNFSAFHQIFTTSKSVSNKSCIYLNETYISHYIDTYLFETVFLKKKNNNNKFLFKLDKTTEPYKISPGIPMVLSLQFVRVTAFSTTDFHMFF